jgi:hypothetical protein
VIGAATVSLAFRVSRWIIDLFKKTRWGIATHATSRGLVNPKIPRITESIKFGAGDKRHRSQSR